MRKIQDIAFFYYSVNLLINLSSEFANGFNLYLVESDIYRILNKKLTETVEQSTNLDQNYLDKIYKIRESTLRFFMNIVQCLNCNPSILAVLIAEVIEDEQNLKDHTNHVFVLLSLAMRNDDFFKILNSPPKDIHFKKILCQSIY